MKAIEFCNSYINNCNFPAKKGICPKLAAITKLFLAVTVGLPVTLAVGAVYFAKRDQESEAERVWNQQFENRYDAIC